MTWFSRFLLEEYDDDRWVHLFRMTKQAILTLCHILALHMQRRDTNYRCVVPVVICVACGLFKVCQGSSLLLCSELFAIGKSTVDVVVREFVQSVNIVLHREVQWPRGAAIQSTADGFKDLCGIPGVFSAIDGTHFAIKKPSFSSVDYYYFKSGGYSMVCQAVVDNQKRFLDLYVGMSGSTNDARVLRRSTLYHKGQVNKLWAGDNYFEGFSPFLLGDAGFPILPWLMVPHRSARNLLPEDAFFNKKLSKGRTVVENAFDGLKMTFKELKGRSDLDVKLFPNVVAACIILYNLLLKPEHSQVEERLQLYEHGFIPAAAEDAEDVVGICLPTSL